MTRLHAAGRPVIFLDGDALRAAIAEDLGHTAANRRRSAMRNARLCQMLAAQGMDVVCATISLFHEVQRWNRENIPGYREIYLRVPMEELRRRDSKGIYARAQRGDTRNVVGLDVPAEAPEAPDLVLDNYGALDVQRRSTASWRCAGRMASASAAPARSSPSGPRRRRWSAGARAAQWPSPAAGPILRCRWRADCADVLAAIAAAAWGSGRVIVRSSARVRMVPRSSQAGKYDSVSASHGIAAWRRPSSG